MTKISKKILIATPMMPPTAGGPATHAKKLIEFFSGLTSSGLSVPLPNPSSLPSVFPGPSERGISATLFNFEKYKKFPSGVRHVLAFFEIFYKALSLGEGMGEADTILALDGFTVAWPSIFVGKILRKKVILRVGGDFIYENFLYTKEVNFEEFYNNFEIYKKLMPTKLYLKYLAQKFLMQNARGIIFNTTWQKDIFEKHYGLQMRKVKVWVVENPIEKIEKQIYESAKLDENFLENLNNQKLIFTSITRDIPYKNQKRVKEVFENLTTPSLRDTPSKEGELAQIYLETKQGSWESCLKRISLSRAYICASISDISPNQVLEALSLGVPVIMTKYCGLVEILKDKGVVRLIDPFDVKDIESAVLEMCDQEKYLIYKKNVEKFNQEQTNQTWEKLFAEYESILNSSL